MAERVDLEAADKLAGRCEQLAVTDDEYELASRTVPALVAELRVAREVVEATRKPTGPGWLDRVHAARDVYDRHAAPSTPDRSEAG